MQTLTVNPPTVDSSLSIFDWDKAETERRERAEVFTEDPLALSWASYRYWEEHKVPWRELRDCLATDRDREDAALCRRYFQDRIMLRMLRSQPLSEFQTDLYQMLGGDVRTKHMGMLHRLPYFYVEDHARKRLMESFSAEEIERVVKEGQYGRDRSLQPMTLTPVAKILRSRKRGEAWEFWFKTQQSIPVKWAVATNNNLIGLVESLYQRPSVDLEVQATWHRWNDMHYLTPVSVRLL